MSVTKKNRIIPALLVLGEDEFIEQTRQITGLTDLIQIDIADGNFVPNKTWAEQKLVCKYWKEKIELHLMVNEPLKYVKKWLKAKQIERVFFHYESPGSTRKAINAIKKYGLTPGLALNLDTPAEVLQDYYKKIDHVLLMSILPGFQGQKFIKSCLTKVFKIKQNWPNLNIEIDGGVKATNLKEIIGSGADAVCVGSEIFKTPDPAKALKKLQRLADKY